MWRPVGRCPDTPGPTPAQKALPFTASTTPVARGDRRLQVALFVEHGHIQGVERVGPVEVDYEGARLGIVLNG